MLRKAPVSYLVVNGDESEPATFKDHLLVERDPHQLGRGRRHRGLRRQVSQAFIFMRGEFALGLERVQQAVNDAYETARSAARSSGRVLDRRRRAPRRRRLHLRRGDGLLESLEGKRGFPRIKPPFFPAVTGLYGEPTVVNNVETMSNLPWIINNGGAAFAALGAGRSTGTRLFALSGRVNNPGVYEVEMVKNTFRDLIFDPSSAAADQRRPVKAFIPGGVSAPWFGPDLLDLPLGQDEVGEKGRCSARARSS
jgi:NADH-quinone oxidoreductase subunit F